MQPAITTNGMYPLIVDQEEAGAANDSARRDAAFEKALLDELGSGSSSPTSGWPEPRPAPM